MKSSLFDDDGLETVLTFSYAGNTFTSKLTFPYLAQDQSIKAKRVLISILSKLYEYGKLPKHVFFDIFGTKICLILLYGIDI
jgi:hypothetical protein